MEKIEAYNLWNEGNRRAVRKACMEDNNLYISLKEYLSEEDYTLLTNRINLQLNQTP